MKIKELLEFNPEAELKILGNDGKEIDILDVCWSANDSGKASNNQRKTTSEVFIEVKNKEKTEWWENVSKEIKTKPYSDDEPCVTTIDDYKKKPWMPSGITATGPSPYTVRFESNKADGKLYLNGESLTVDSLPNCTISNVFDVQMYQEEGIHLDSVYKIVKMPSSNCLKKNIGAQEGHYIRLHYILTNKATYNGTNAQYMEVTDLTTNKTHKISMNILANALKHYTLERIR